ncbi:hypothetical protein DRO58_00755 [Candidatus Bathyarchaeota archaeon]|nr:MAG: hypothetical protein DRO58_00755 [Candidatus Bathyarchaeota archaeon]
MIEKSHRARLGVAGAVAAAAIAILAVLSAFLIAELAFIYQKYGLAAVQNVREAHEREKEQLKIYYTKNHPLIAAALAETRGADQSISVVGPSSQGGYFTFIVRHGYPVGIKYVILADKDEKNVKEAKSFDTVIEPPCLVIEADNIGFNKMEEGVVKFVSSRGRIYQALNESPKIAEVIPCIYTRKGSNNKNSFDLKVEASPAKALGQVTVKVITGSCLVKPKREADQIRINGCRPITVVLLTAEDSSEYTFSYWQVEGEKYNTPQLLLLLEQDYNIVAEFEKVGGGGS